MKKFLQILLIIVVPQIIIYTIVAVWKPDNVMQPFDHSSIQYEDPADISVSHMSFEQLQQPFDSAQQVTRACLECHNNVDDQLMLSEHWTWHTIDSIPGRGNFKMGKENIINNFCVGAATNEELCAKCHAGYDYTVNTFDPAKTENMDCLMCHDKTGTYKKGAYGNPIGGIDLNYVAKNVGEPGRKNCGFCHFYGGGGNNSKHGDLEGVLNACTKEIDVHMDKDGLNMSCVDCHETNNHIIPGNLPMISSTPKNQVSCSQCHTDKPHKSKLLNNHYTKVACQTCHIPTYAKDAKTKVFWDWSTAGKTDYDGSILDSTYDVGQDTSIRYDSKHGTTIYAKNLEPEYLWSNGYTDHHFTTDTITEDTLYLTKLFGSYEDFLNPMDPENPSKIYPFKVMRGIQPYDPVYNKIVQINTYGKAGSGAFWKDFDWDASIRNGMEYINQPWSGEYDFIPTVAHWPVSHMVAPVEQSLSCEECHAKDGRLENLKGFYLPGRDKSKLIDTLGIIFIILTFGGVTTHGIMRRISRKKCK